MRKSKYSPFGIPHYCCFADGGAATPPADPATPPETPPVTPPPETPPTTPPAATVTAEQLATAKKQAADDAVAAYKQHLEEAKDFEKMTADEKVVYLQQQMADEKLTGYTTQQLSASGLPAELASFVKGTDEKDTDERIKTLKAAYDKGVQAGVEQRFKANGYIPKGTAAGQPGDEGKKRPRGVSVK
jgi:hypothetical protein